MKKIYILREKKVRFARYFFVFCADGHRKKAVYES